MPLPDAPVPPRRIALAGATGLVGRALIPQLLADTPAPLLHLLVRRPLPDEPALHGLRRLVVDFAALPALPPLDEAYCALGTTIAQAGSEAAFRTVDFDAVLAFAQAAHAAGADRFAVVSAQGADAAARVFYNRVKGEMEQALRRVGFDTLVIARPSLLVGDRAALGQPARTGERLAIALTRPLARLIPARLRPIKADDVARGMLVALRQGRPGTHIVESAELQTLAHRP